MNTANESIIRFASLNDLPLIVEIYNQAIRSKNATGDIEEFKVQDRIDWFNKFNQNKYPLYVTEFNKKVIGFCSISPYRPGRKAMKSVAEISYYIDYSFHKKGFGSSLLKYAINDCKRIGKKNLLAFILDVNLPTIHLLKKFNFVKLGHMPNIIEFNHKTCGHLIYGLKIKST